MSEKNGMLFLVIAVLVVGALLIAAFRVVMPEMFESVTTKMKAVINGASNGNDYTPKK